MKTPAPALAGRHPSALAFIIMAMALAACTAELGAYSTRPGQPTDPTSTLPPSGGPAPSGAPAPAPGPTCNPAQKSFAPARLWQLTDAQYVNVVRDVFSIALTGSDAEIVSEGSADRYTNYSEGVAIGDQVAPNYQTAAIRVAGLAVASMATLLGSATPDDARVRAFLTDRVARAWRRPLEPDELAGLLDLYHQGQDAPTGLNLVMQAVLQAPSFLYRTELGTSAATAKGPVQLTAHELASALSFFFLETSPDDELWGQARAGKLGDPAVLASEVDRLMAMPAARANLTRKASYWLGLEALPGKIRDQRLYRAFTDSFKASLYASVQAFLTDTLWNGALSDLFTSPRLYLNQELGRAYGVAVTGTDLVPVDGPATQRGAGILTQPGLLVAANKWNERGDPIHRGLMIYDSFVCGAQIPPPPADAATVAATISGSEREKAAIRDGLPACAACHLSFDPLGLPFERYDAMGRYYENRQVVLDSNTGVSSWQMTDTPIDTSSVLSTSLGPDLAGPVADVGELAGKLAANPGRVGACASRRLAEYGLGHNPDAENSCELEQVRAAFIETGSFSEFFRALVLSPGFRTRDASVM
jgi:hypothetical protein